MLADFLLALKAFGEDLVAFDLGMWKLDRHDLSGSKVGRAVNRRHVAARNHAFNLVVIELVAGLNGFSSSAGRLHPYFSSEAVSLTLTATKFVPPGVIVLKLESSGGLPLSRGAVPAAEDVCLPIGVTIESDSPSLLRRPAETSNQTHCEGPGESAASSAERPRPSQLPRCARKFPSPRPWP